MHAVIVGNGAAGMEAARLLRERAPGWEITVVSEESDHHFSRPALMWVGSGQLRHVDTEPLERDAYARLRLHRVRARAIGIDPLARRVRMAGDVPDLGYDRLLLACGSRPRPGPWPGAELRGVGALVTHQDLAWYEEELLGRVASTPPPRPRAHLRASGADSPYRFRHSASSLRGRPARRVAVIGGGLIGIEAVELALASGASPHFFIREDWFWPMAIDARESAWIAERMREHGVSVHLATEVEALEADSEGSVVGVRTSRGSVACDAALVAIGVVPNTTWLEGSGLARCARGGVVVDEALRTSLPGIWAAGDCASVPQPGGAHVPEPLWYTARAQGRVAALGMLGAPSRYARGIPYDSAKLMDLEYTTVGAMDGPEVTTWYFEERGRVRSTTRVAVSRERVVGFNMLGRRWDYRTLMGWIAEERPLPWVLRHLTEASFDTELVPPLVLPRSP